jgi:hypothetical protein
LCRDRKRLQLPVRTYLAWIHGEAHYLEANRDVDAYTLVNTFRSGGLRIESCGTCANFRFSGMSHAGYCTKRLVPGKTDFDIKRDEPSPFAVISVWDRCLDYSFTEDQARPDSWCSAGRLNDFARPRKCAFPLIRNLVQSELCQGERRHHDIRYASARDQGTFVKALLLHRESHSCRIGYAV